MGAVETKLPPGHNPIRQDPDKIENLAKALDVKAGRQRQLQVQNNSDRMELDKQSLQSLKSLFKKLDPTVVKSPSDINGEIELSFKYDEKRQLLLVKVIRCRALHAKDVRRKASDSYVRIQLYPDLHSHGAKVTQIVVETKEPTFNEIFAFKMRKKELEDTKLVVQVFDYDCVTRDDFLGEVIVQLSQFNFDTEPVLTAWYTLSMEKEMIATTFEQVRLRMREKKCYSEPQVQTKTDLSITGDLEVSLHFLKPQTLMVSVLQAYGLSNRKDGKPVQAFVKCTIPGTSSVHKTQTVVANDGDPEWEETFEFDIPQEELGIRYILLHVTDAEAHSEHNTLGQIIIDLDTLDLDNGFNGRLKLADLRSSDRLRNKQEQHKVAQEFREAFHAHAFARYPNFLFQQHTGKKTVTVTCRKAGVKGKIQMIDGVPVF